MSKDKITPAKNEFWIRFGMIAGLILVVLAIVGTTLAIFFHEQEQDETINFGVIKLGGSGSYFDGQFMEKAIPGGQMTGEIKIEKDTDSNPLYIRLKVEFEIPSYESIRLEEELDVLNASNFNESVYIGDDYMWSDKQDDGYYYLLNRIDGVDKNGVDLYILNNNAALFADSLYLPYSFEQEVDEEGNVLSYGANIYMSLCIEAIQAENVPEDSQRIADIKKYFDYKKLPFSFRYGLYEDNDEMINYFGYNVGDPLPEIVRGDRKLIWFADETCSGQCYPEDATIEENGVYYGAWFYTGITGFTFTPDRTKGEIASYNGYERNVITPTVADNGLPVTQIRTLYGGNNTSLKRIIVSDGVSVIHGGAFANAYQLTSVVFPSTLSTIGGSAKSLFNETKCDVTRLTIPASVKNILEGAFKTISLSRVVFEGNAIEIAEKSVFITSTSLCNPYLDIIVPNKTSFLNKASVHNDWKTKYPIYDTTGSNPTPYDKIYYGGAYYIKQETAAGSGEYVALPVEYNRLLTSFIIPPYAVLNGEKLNVKQVADFAAYGYSKVTEIVISEGVTKLGDNSFANCIALLDVDLPNSLLHIGRRAFENCTRLFDITMSKRLTTIGDYAFRNVNSELRTNSWLKTVEAEKEVLTYTYNGSSYVANNSVKLSNNQPVRAVDYDVNSEYTKVYYEGGAEDGVYVRTRNIEPKIVFKLPYTVATIGCYAFDKMGFEVVVFRTDDISGFLYYGDPAEENKDVFGDKNYYTKTIYVPEGKLALYQAWLSRYGVAANNNAFEITYIEGLPN